MELFLSHATVDADLVQLIKKRLEPLDVRVYTAEYDNRAGDNVHGKIAEAISRCDLVVVLLTAAGYDSKYVHQEIGYARRSNKLTIPLVTSAATAGGLGMLEGIEYIAVEEDDPAEALRKLSRRIGDLQAKRQRQDDLVLAGLVLVVLGIMIVALNE